LTKKINTKGKKIPLGREPQKYREGIGFGHVNRGLQKKKEPSDRRGKSTERKELLLAPQCHEQNGNDTTMLGSLSRVPTSLKKGEYSVRRGKKFGMLAPKHSEESRNFKPGREKDPSRGEGNFRREKVI